MPLFALFGEREGYLLLLLPACQPPPPPCSLSAVNPKQCTPQESPASALLAKGQCTPGPRPLTAFHLCHSPTSTMAREGAAPLPPSTYVQICIDQIHVLLSKEKHLYMYVHSPCVLQTCAHVYEYA